MTSWIVEAYTIKRKAPCTDSWDMLKFMVFSFEYETFIETVNVLGIRQFFYHSRAVSVTLNLWLSTFSSSLWSTVSKAVLRSRIIIDVTC